MDKLKTCKSMVAFTLLVVISGLRVAGAQQGASNDGGRLHKALAPTTDWVRHNVGRIGLIVSNIGLFGGEGSYTIRDKSGKEVIGCEYPIGSNVAFLSGCGLWVTAVVGNDTLATTSYEPANEWLPTDDPGDTIMIKSNLSSSPYYDTSAVSEQDFIAKYQDDFWPVPGHVPMRVQVIQKSFAWSISYLSDFVFFDYSIINKNTQTLNDAYVGYWVDADVGYYTPGFTPPPADGDIARFDGNRMMGIMSDADGDGGRSTGQLGMRILRVPPTQDFRLTFGWVAATAPSVQLPWAGKGDRGIYQTLSSGNIMPDQLPSEASDTRFFFGFGPFTVQPGDTLNFVLAIVAAPSDQKLGANADRAKELFDLNYQPPYVPPSSPPLRATVFSKKVILNWQWTAGSPGSNPEVTPDPKSGVVDFEGYRVYKGVPDPLNPSREPQDYVLLAQYDVINGIGYDTGLRHEYVDEGLIDGIPYYFAVTSFDKGDTLNDVESLESSIRQNLISVFPGSPARDSPQLEVAVVPNPYIGSANYTQPVRWEDFAGDGWIEQDRRIRFINLPPTCTIRIYTLGGDLVKMIEHNDPTRGYEDWNLVSIGNQAIVSDLYLFSVESPFGTQVGKFVVIK